MSAHDEQQADQLERYAANPDWRDEFRASLLAGAAALRRASPETGWRDIQRHMLLTLGDMGVEDGRNLADVQRRLHVDAPTAMRLFALLNAVKSMPVPPAPPEVPHV